MKRIKTYATIVLYGDNMKKMKDNFKLRIIGGLIGLCIMVVIGSLTYAYFAARIEGLTDTSVVIETADYGVLRVNYPAGRDIIFSDNEELPYSERNSIKSSLIKFSVSNSGTIDQSVVVGMKDVINSFCQYADEDTQRCTDDPATGTYVGNELVYNLYQCNSQQLYVEASISNVADYCNIVSEADAPTPKTSAYAHLLNIDSVVVPQHNEVYFVLVIRLKNLDKPQNYNSDKEFGGTTYVELYNNMLITWEGQLLDDEGNPIPLANLTLHSREVSTVTDDNGYFRFEDVLPYDHTLTYEKDGVTVSSKIKIIPSDEMRVSTDTINYVTSSFGVNTLKIEDQLQFVATPQVDFAVVGGYVPTNFVNVVGTEDILVPITPYVGYVLVPENISCTGGAIATIENSNIVVDPSSTSGSCRITLVGKEYVATFAQLNGETSTTKTVQYKTEYGELPTPSVIPNGSNTFNGWWTEENGGSRITATSLVNIVGDHTLYAHYKNQWLLTYDCTTNGGTCADNTILVDENTDVDLTKEATKLGAHFIGWNTDSTSYTAINSFSIGTAPKTIYAIFKTDATIPDSSYCSNPVYTGSEQEITNTPGTGYSFTSNRYTNAQRYTVNAVLDEGYIWSDGETGNKTITCPIASAPGSGTVNITGTNKVGQTLTADVTTDSTGEITYQWYRSDTDSVDGSTAIGSATNATYLLTTTDLDKYIYCVAHIDADSNNNAVDITDFTDATTNTWNTVVENVAPVISLPVQSTNAYAKQTTVQVDITDSGIGMGTDQSISYGWSSSNSVEPQSYTDLALEGTSGQVSIEKQITQGSLHGEYYLWIKPTTSLCDLANNCTTSSITSTGTFKFDNVGPVVSDLSFTPSGNTLHVEASVTDEFTNMVDATYTFGYTTEATCDGVSYPPAVDSNEYIFTSLPERAYTICVYATDNLTNVSEVVYSEQYTLYYASFGDDHITYTSPNALGYKMLKDADVSKVLTAATLTSGAGPAATTNIVAENGIYRTSDNDGYTYYYRGGEGCSSLGAALPAYTSYATCNAANGNWASINDIDYACYTNGTKAVCEANGGTWTKLNNYVTFAGFNWRIVRMNGDRSIRLVLDGVTSTVKQASSGSFAGTNQIYNNSSDYNAGTPADGTMETAQEYASFDGGNLESAINSFYDTYLDTYGSSFEDSSFCSNTTYGHTATENKIFTPGINIWDSSFTPGAGLSVLTCPQDHTYKVSGTTGVRLTNPVGTLSADEVIYAGGRGSTYNSTYYLNNNETITGIYWTMSPYSFDKDGYVSAIAVTAGGRVGVDDVSDSNGVRIVVNLKPNTLITGGNGTKSSPYQI